MASLKKSHSTKREGFSNQGGYLVPKKLTKRSVEIDETSKTFSE
jgi:hypothetical protein